RAELQLPWHRRTEDADHGRGGLELLDGSQLAVRPWRGVEYTDEPVIYFGDQNMAVRSAKLRDAHRGSHDYLCGGPIATQDGGRIGVVGEGKPDHIAGGVQVG